MSFRETMQHSKTSPLRRTVPLAVAILAAPLALPATTNCPEGMARINDRFCIDRWEASLVEQLPGGTEQLFSPYHSPDPHAHVRAVSRLGVVPQGHVNAVQAEHACRASGRRLCNDDEWLAACRGPARTVFPYGNAREAGRCNENHSRHPTVELFGGTGAGIWDFVHQNDPRTNQLPGTLALTGAFAGCSNAFGVYDMVGNLHEWTSDPDGTFRGGYYMDTRLNGDGCNYTTRAHNRDYHDFSTGFRCCVSLNR